MEIDTSFDVRRDTRPGKDPDKDSPTLRRYHQLLWSKPLPNGTRFVLVTPKRGAYLYHESHLGTFKLSSDRVLATLRKRARPVVGQMPEAEMEAFVTIGNTIGGTMVFPSNRVDRKQTLNGARGFHPRIADRMDLTLESIRRHYLGEWSPLQKVLARYVDFFELFGDFAGYVDFFLLQDLVIDDETVRFFMPFDDFKPPSVPRDVETYEEYRRRSMAFVAARNRRIDALGL